MKDISLVIPCAAEDVNLVKLLLVSVNYQTCLPVEVIIALSGVNAIVGQHWRTAWRRVLNPAISLTVLDEQRDILAGENRARGAVHASSEIISWFDADDIQSPDRLMNIARAFENSDTLAVYHRFKRPGQRDFRETDRLQFLYEDATDMYHRGWVSIHRSVLEIVEWNSSPRYQDFIYLQDLLKKVPESRIDLLPEILGTFVEYDFRKPSPPLSEQHRVLTGCLFEAGRSGTRQVEDEPCTCVLELIPELIPVNADFDMIIVCLLDEEGHEICRMDIPFPEALKSASCPLVIGLESMSGPDPVSGFVWPRLATGQFVDKAYFSLPEEFTVRYNMLFSWYLVHQEPC